MSDGQGSAPDKPPGWAAEQPPPYPVPGGSPGASPWAAPGGTLGPAPSPAPVPAPAAPGSTAAPPQGPPPPPTGPLPAHPGHPPPPAPHGAAFHRPPPGYGPHYGHRPPPPALRPGIIPLRPLGLGDILDGTIKLIRSNPKAVLGMSAVAAAVGALPIAVGQAWLIGSTGGAFDDPAALEAAPVAGVLGYYGSTLLSLVVQFLAVTVLTGLLTRILGRAVFGGRITAGEAWGLTRARVPALFGLALLTGLIMLAPLIIIIPAFVALAAAGADPVAALGVGLLMLILYIPYVLVLSTRLALAPPAVVLEGLGVIAAMRRSWRLVTGDFWRVFGILLLTSLMVGMISGILSLPFTIAGTAIGVLGGGGTGVVILTAILIAVGTTLGSMIVYPIQAGVNGLLYTDRRMRAEAFDLVLQTAALEQQRQGWVHASADDLWHPANSAARGGHDAPGAL